MTQKISNEMFAVSKKVGMAIADYDMLLPGDKIIIAVSGGKDSAALLKLMRYRAEFIPIDMELLAVHIDMGAPFLALDELTHWMEQQGVKTLVEKIPFLKEGERWADITCFWCAWNRRKALFQLAGRLGFNKIAFGHHKDDIIETMLMNLFYKAEISAMRPKQELFGGKLTIIRPLAYVEQDEIRRMAQREGIKEFDRERCPHDEDSKRKTVKDLIARLASDNPHVKNNIFKSLSRIKEEYCL